MSSNTACSRGVSTPVASRGRSSPAREPRSRIGQRRDAQPLGHPTHPMQRPGGRVAMSLGKRSRSLPPPAPGLLIGRAEGEEIGSSRPDSWGVPAACPAVLGLADGGPRVRLGPRGAATGVITAQHRGGVPVQPVGPSWLAAIAADDSVTSTWCSMATRSATSSLSSASLVTRCSRPCRTRHPPDGCDADHLLHDCRQLLETGEQHVGQPRGQLLPAVLAAAREQLLGKERVALAALRNPPQPGVRELETQQPGGDGAVVARESAASWSSSAGHLDHYVHRCDVQGRSAQLFPTSSPFPDRARS